MRGNGVAVSVVVCACGVLRGKGAVEEYQAI